ncbi:MAG: hypothetical protein K2X38_15340 [Gemmataceae bacterium]|nr:hypothetical protein [Gemmataceae bacterium]
MRRLICVIFLLLPAFLHAAPLRVAVFEADVTPPIGTPLCDALVMPAKEIVDSLSARGIVLLGSGDPIVLVAIDWVGIGNSGHDAFRDAIAKAAKTKRERVAVHCLHQHDAPGCDFQADEILAKHQLSGKLFDPAFARKAIDRVAAAAAKALDRAEPVTHLGVGKAKVEEVASNRRVMGLDGKVKHVRFSATKDPKVRAEPEGLIDPYLQSLTFWNGDRPIAVLSYYATHPQSHYGKGQVSCDFPGLARNLRDKAMPGTMHIHFNGAGGNVTAGKYNDGAVANRPILAQRLETGMKSAFDSSNKAAIDAKDVEWRRIAITLPPSERLKIDELSKMIADESAPLALRLKSARDLAWAERCRRGDKIDVQALKLGGVYVLHLPGELFVEYQLAAQKMRPNDSVLTAAYGDYGMGYIGVQAAYSEGGYETGPVSRVAPNVESPLMDGIRQLLR